MCVTWQLEQKKEAEKQAQLAAMRQHHEDMMRRCRQDQENRATLKLLKFGQEFTKSWIFSYFVLWPRGSYERWAGLIYIIYAWLFAYSWILYKVIHVNLLETMIEIYYVLIIVLLILDCWARKKVILISRREPKFIWKLSTDCFKFNLFRSQVLNVIVHWFY